MNPHLQSIYDVIQQDENLGPEQKVSITKSLREADEEFGITAFKLDRTEKVRTTTAILLEETIRELEQKRKSVELQNRELEIEASLERVRTVAMGMRNPDDILDICKGMFTELQLLGFTEVRNSLINFWDDESYALIDYDYSDYSGGHKAKLSYSSHPVFEQFQKKIRQSKDSFAELIVEEELLESWKQRRRESGEYEDPRLENINALYYYFYSIGVGAVGISTFSSLTTEKLNILKRFRNVFDLAYWRYLDIATAQAQAKEAQIELALERVRARTMAMQHSSELAETATVLFEQFEILGEVPERVAIEIVNEKDNVFEIWATQHGGTKMDLLLKCSLDEPHVMQPMYQAWKEEKKSITIDLQGNALEEYFHFLEEAGLPVKREIFGTRRVQNVATFSKGILTIITPEPRPPETIRLLERFAQVFDGTYTRFLDLQKAEAQAREAQIELGLERVRAKAMAMQKSDELAALVDTVFNELKKLHFLLDRCLIMIYDPESSDSTWWLANPEPETIPVGVKVKYHKHLPYLSYIKAWKNKMVKWQYLLEGPLKKKWDDFIFSETEMSLLPQPVIAGMKSVERIYLNVSFNNFGSLTASSFEPLPEEQFTILLRFAKVFDLTYTRFNDLLTAEAQAREAKIEAALERTRTHTMLMQHSNELDITSRVFHEQLLLLGIDSELSYVWLPDVKNDKHLFWATWNEEENGSNILQSKSATYDLDRTEPYTAECFNAWESGEPVHVYRVAPAEVKHYFDTWSGIMGEAKKLTPEFFPEGLDYVESFMKYGCFGIIIRRMLTEDEKKILLRFTIEFERTYTRFLDLKKAEAQAREAQVEAALERVRSRAMAMHKTDQLLDAAELVYKELSALGIESMNVSYAFMSEDEKYASYYSLNPVDGKIPPFPFIFPHTETEVMRSILSSWKKQEAFNVIELDEEATLKHQTYIGEHILNLITKNNTNIPFSIEAFLAISPRKAVIYTFNFTKGYLFNIGGVRLTGTQEEMLLRFTKVFDLTYTRFLDLQKAEAQAKEAKIEAALERVRSRTMGMQKSQELKEVIQVVYEQFVHLNMHIEHTGFIMDYKARDDMHIWLADKHEVPSQVTIPYFDCAHWNSFNEAKEKGNHFFANHLDFEEKNRFYQDLFKLFPVPDETRDYYLTCPGLAISTVLLENVGLYIENFSGIRYTDEENNTLMRFGKVFQQTYTRFLDLQKAEAQAREAQIELGLERVRARAMAMQKSGELSELVDTVFKELTKLDFALTWCIINIIDESSLSNTVWAANPEIDQAPESYHLLFEDYPFHHAMMKGWKERKTISVYVLEGTEKKIYDEYLFNETEFRKVPEAAQAASRAIDKYVCSFSFSNFGGLQTVGDVPLSDANLDILSRFGKVFDLTYTRFNDLKQAEAQAREAQIEAALEKVRSRTMAMQHSDELQDTALLLVHQVKRLGVPTFACGFNIWDGDRKAATAWMAGEERLQPPFKTSSSEDVFLHIHEAVQRGEQLFIAEQGGEELETHYRYMATIPEFKAVMDKMAEAGLSVPTFQIIHCAFFTQGYLMFISFERVPEAHDIFKRFAKVFEQTYTRFLDLQKAEAQAREAKIEACLERVRSKAMAMHSSQDLADTIVAFYHELELFSITPRRCGVGLLNKETRIAELSTMNATEQGKSIEIVGKIVMEKHPVLEKVYENWLLNKEYHPVLRGNEIKEYYQLLRPQIAFPDYRDDTVQFGYFFFFPEGGVYAWTEREMKEEELIVYRRFTSVLSLTYKRYKDLQKAEALAVKAEQDLILLKKEKKRTEEALTELQVTQKQLIQSEKMASLGELTAGIAHEIQNPLNFVNNFSEVSNELIDEMMEEVAKGNYEEAKAISDDVKENLSKISHHGKRADGIVKGMLQHSRNSTGLKEPTDINALADEYLRLSYHGMRAKDKSFNATLKTDYDDSIGHINIIPQDLGRVILNLITNAFYAVNEKTLSAVPDPAYRQAGPSAVRYEPTVSVSTKKMGDKVLVSVKDNGNGIPQKAFDKIFQPFFTTKPTGQGTGLGLSLSYDIVKAHGGELKVKTKEREGSEFIIQLPIV